MASRPGRKDAERCATARARQAELFGDKGLQVQLEDMVRDETEHLEETQRILRAWSGEPR